MLFAYISSLFLIFIQIFTKKRTKIVIYLTLFFIVYFIGTESTHGDSFNYYWSYTNSVHMEYDIEILYLVLEKIGNLIGFNYFTFRTLLAFMSTMLIYSTIKKYSGSLYFVYFFVLIYLVFIDSIQLRNYIAFSIIVFAFRYLIEKGKFWRLKYVTLVIIASGIHITSLLYLILILVNGKNKKKIIRSFVFFTITLSVIALLNDNQLPFIDNIIALFDHNEKIKGYFSTTTQLGFLIPLVLHLLSLFSVLLSYRIMLKNSQNIANYDKSVHIIEVIYWTNLLSLIFVPLYITNINFYRLSRNYIVLNLIANSLAFQSLKKNVLKQILFLIVIFLVVYSWFYFDFIYGDPSGEIIDNLILNERLFRIVDMY